MGSRPIGMIYFILKKLYIFFKRETIRCFPFCIPFHCLPNPRMEFPRVLHSTFLTPTDINEGAPQRRHSITEGI